MAVLNLCSLQRSRDRSIAAIDAAPTGMTMRTRIAAPALMALIAVSALAAEPPAEPPPAERAFDWSADVVSSDFRNDTLTLSGNVRVTQGSTSIEAETASAKALASEDGDEGDNSEWTFENSVHIRTPEADLRSNSARAEFVDGQIVKARVTGSPALFEQIGGEADARVRGRAGLIEYDFRAGIVKLTDRVWFSNGKDEFRGDVVIYNVRDERVQINPKGQSSGRVRGIIRPREPASSPDGNSGA